MNKQNGVTLIELMTALAVAAILMSIAIPSFRQSIINNRLASITNEFISGINFARSEAIKLGRSVTLCKSTDGSSCSTDNAEFWEDGWIAFADLDADGVVDTSEILRTWPALDASYTLRSSEFPDSLRYNPQGASTGDGTFAVCHDSSEAGATALIITRLRPRSGIDSDNDQIPETDVDGSNGNIGSCEAP